MFNILSLFFDNKNLIKEVKPINIEDCLILLAEGLSRTYSPFTSVFLRRHEVLSWKDLGNIVFLLVHLKILIPSDNDDYNITDKLDKDMPLLAYVDIIDKEQNV